MYLSNPSPNHFQSRRKATLEDPSNLKTQQFLPQHTASHVTRVSWFRYATKREAERTVATFLSSFSVADGDTPRMS